MLLRHKFSFPMKRLLLILISFAAIHACTPESDPDNAREDFLGDWTCNEYEGDFAPQTYNVEILASGTGKSVLIVGLYNQGSNFVLSGYVDGRTLFINTQTVDGFNIGGSGNMANSFDRIELSFTADDGSGSDNVKATLLR